VGGVAGRDVPPPLVFAVSTRRSHHVLERSGHVSFANCGLPYFVGGIIEEEATSRSRPPNSSSDRFRLDVRVNQEVVAIDRSAGAVRTRSTISGQGDVVPYDKLVLSMGAAPVRPPIPGYERVRTLRTVEDATRLATEVDVAPDTAVVIGAGFIGLEMAENLSDRVLGSRSSRPPSGLPPLDLNSRCWCATNW